MWHVWYTTSRRRGEEGVERRGEESEGKDQLTGTYVQKKSMRSHNRRGVWYSKRGCARGKVRGW